MEVQMIHVGGVLDGAKGAAEGCSVNFPGSDIRIVITMKEPTKYEIEQIQSGDIEYKLAVVDGVPFFLVRYGELSWMELPVIKAKDHVPEVSIDTFEEGCGYMMTTLICDVPSGVVKGMRVIGMESDVSNAITEAVNKATLHDDLYKACADILKAQNKHSQKDILIKATHTGKLVSKSK